MEKTRDYLLTNHTNCQHTVTDIILYQRGAGHCAVGGVRSRERNRERERGGRLGLGVREGDKRGRKRGRFCIA